MDKNSDEILNDERVITANNTTASVPVETVDEFSDGDKELINSGRMTADQIRAAKSFNGEGSALNYYNEIFKKPELDEKTLRRNRTIGILGDGIKLLGQMYGAGKGARIERNDPAQSLTSYFSNREDEARKLYQKNLEDYNRGYYNAAMNDKQMTNSYSMNLQNQRAGELRHIETVKRDDTRRKEDIERDDTRYAERIQTEKERYEDQKTHRDKEFEETKKQHEISNSHTARQIAIQEQKIKANNKLLAARAVTDDGFAKAHPEYFRTVKVKDYGGAEHLEPTRKPDIDDSALALAYEQYLEEQEKKAATAAANGGSGSSGSLLP